MSRLSPHDDHPLPRGSDVAVSASQEGTLFEFRAGRTSRVRWYALGWLIALAGGGLIGGGALWWWLDSQEKATGAAWVPVGVGAFLALPFLLVQLQVATRRATTELTDTGLSVLDQAEHAAATVALRREQVAAVTVETTGRPDLILGGGRSGGHLFGVRLGRKHALRVTTRDDRQFDVLVGWEREDLDYLADRIADAWRMQRRPLLGRTTSRSVLDAEKMSNRRSFAHAVPLPKLGLLVVCAAFILWSTLSGLLDGIDSINWSSTRGTVRTAEYRVTGSESKPGYQAFATYNYTVAGQQYIGDTVTFAHQAGEDYVRALIEPAQPGDPITVYYDPADPQRSVLIPGVDYTRPVMTGVAFVIVAMAFIVIRVRRKQRREDSTMPV